jgi:membrane protease YdiL (CAAX protease family)
LVVLIYLGADCYGQLLVRHAPEKWFPPAAWLPRATNGLLNFTFACTVAIQLVLIGGFLIGICRFRPREIGLDPAKLPAAVLFTTLIWAADQVVLVIILALMGHEIALNPNWRGSGWTWAAGQWLAQLFGVTPPEEVAFRGFLLPQCLLLMLGWMPTARPGMQIGVALVLSQGLFALSHVFGNLYRPQGEWLLLFQFAMGLAFAGVYLRTGNLFLAMGVHALSNNPSPLIKDPFDGPGLGGGIIMLGTLLSVILGPWAVGFVRRWTSPAAPGTSLEGRRPGVREDG